MFVSLCAPMLWNQLPHWGDK